MEAALAGLLAGLSLIVAIGAQNAFVLRQGLARRHVAAVVGVCALADALLIIAGVAGLGALIRDHDTALRLIAGLGALYLGLFAIRSLLRAARPTGLTPADGAAGSRRAALLAALGFTFLNPHVYLDTVLLLGAIGSSFGAERWWFAAGAIVASIGWFSALGFGARALAPVMARPVTWRVLDLAIGVVMALLALGLAREVLF